MFLMTSMYIPQISNNMKHKLIMLLGGDDF